MEIPETSNNLAEFCHNKYIILKSYYSIQIYVELSTTSEISLWKNAFVSSLSVKSMSFIDSKTKLRVLHTVEMCCLKTLLINKKKTLYRTILIKYKRTETQRLMGY